MPRDSMRVVQVSASPSIQPHGGEWAQLSKLGRFEGLVHVHVAICGVHQRDYIEVWTTDGYGAHTDGSPVAPSSPADEHWLESGCSEHIIPSCFWIVLGAYPDFPTVRDEAGAGGVEQAIRG